MKTVVTAPSQTADQRLEAVSAFQWSSKTLYLKILDDDARPASSPAYGEAHPERLLD